MNSHAIGLIGRGIGQSSSPAIHEREARALGIALTYRLVDFDALGLADDRLADAVAFLRGIGFSGSNVTHPFKQQVMALCDTLSIEAEALGAVNTLVFADGAVHGHNTDWIGFSFQLEIAIGSVKGARVGQLGAGGAGSATAYALAREAVAELVIFDPSQERAEQLVDRLVPLFPAVGFSVAATAEGAVSGVDGIVQATPVGMAAHPGMPVDPARIEPPQWLADIIYFPRETELLAATRARGCVTANGTSMVIGQAAEAFHLMTGHMPDRGRMLAALMEADA